MNNKGPHGEGSSGGAKIEGDNHEGKEFYTNPLFSSRSLPLKLEVKFVLPTFNGEATVGKLNHWLKQIHVYCRVQQIENDR